MKFLVGAQLPRRLISRLQEAGHEAIHTLDLPLGNRTPDSIINELSISDGYVVITKDADFVNSFSSASKTSQAAINLNRKHPKFGVGVAVYVKSGKHCWKL